MDRNNIIGLVLIFVIFAGSFYLMKPSEQEIKQEQALQDSLKKVREGIVDTSANNQPGNTTIATVDSVDLSKPFGGAKSGDERFVTLENELIKAEITTKGGKVKKVQLKEETNFDGTPLYLVE